MGKTRLATECMQVLRAQGHAVERVTATNAGAAVPFAAMAALLPRTVLRAETTDRTDLLRQAGDALAARADGQRLYLLADNANALDDASAMLIHYLIHTDTACVVSTLRAGDPAPAPVTDLWKDGIVERTELNGLDASAVGEILEVALNGPVDRASVLHLAHRCEGNMLFLRELVLGAARSRTIRNDDGIWYLAEPTALSDRLVELIRVRLGRLDKTEWKLLELVSFGEPLSASELGRLSDPDLAVRLEEKGILVSSRVGDAIELRFAHPLYGEVVRNRTSALRVPIIARALAEAVEERAVPTTEDKLRIAAWRLECGGGSAGTMLDAARAARSRYDFALADRLCQAAIEAGGGFEAELLAAQLACLRGRADEAIARLAGLEKMDLSDIQRGGVIVSQLDTIGFYEGRVREGMAIAEGALRKIQDRGWRDEISGRNAAFVLATEGPAAALDLSSRLMRDGARGRARVWACIIASYTLGRQGRISEALEVADEGYAAHLALTDERIDWYPWIHVFLRCEALGHAGRFVEAERIAREQYQQGLVLGSAEAQAFFSWHLAMTVGERGQTSLALRHAREAVTQFRALGRPQYVREMLLAVSLAASLNQDVASARRALAGVGGLDLDSPPWKSTELLAAQAWALVAEGEIAHALASLRDAVAFARSCGDRVGESAVLHAIARLGQPREVVDGLTELAKTMEGDLIQARAEHTAALVARDPRRLDSVADAFTRMGAFLLAAEAAADAAVALRFRGITRKVAAADAKASGLARQVSGVRTPALQSATARAILTSSERQVGLLAAAGRSNRQIAQELCVSVRTVENHLQRSYTKLGIAGRSELAPMLEPAARPDD